MYVCVCVCVCVRQRNELTTSHRGDPPTRLGCLRSRQREVRRLITYAASDLMTDVYQKVREGHRFDLLERGFQHATERNFSYQCQYGAPSVWLWMREVSVFNSVKIFSFSFYFPFSFIQLGSCSSQPLVSFCPFIVCFLLFYETYL